MIVGTVATLLLIYFSPTIQIDILGQQAARFPLKNPALVTVPLSFLSGVGVSLLSPEIHAAGAYAQLERQMHLGVEISDGASQRQSPGR